MSAHNARPTASEGRRLTGKRRSSSSTKHPLIVFLRASRMSGYGEEGLDRRLPYAPTSRCSGRALVGQTFCLPRARYSSTRFFRIYSRRVHRRKADKNVCSTKYMSHCIEAVRCRVRIADHSSFPRAASDQTRISAKKILLLPGASSGIPASGSNRRRAGGPPSLSPSLPCEINVGRSHAMTPTRCSVAYPFRSSAAPPTSKRQRVIAAKAPLRCIAVGNSDTPTEFPRKLAPTYIDTSASCSSPVQHLDTARASPRALQQFIRQFSRLMLSRPLQASPKRRRPVSSSTP